MLKLERALCNGAVAFFTTALALQANGMLAGNGWLVVLMTAALTGGLAAAKDYQDQLKGKDFSQKSLLLVF